ncbi:uncharacterized protein N7500_001992, partial [Penicillium coprophilum]|uniref:uncharacterized protein n=1 Tax=Penicillium coprophilum TaxID=36646 RepID=UPI00239ECD88
IASNLNREKRKTQFPKKLWLDKESIVKESTEIKKPNKKLVQNNYIYRLRVPIILTKNINSLLTIKVESPCSIQNTHTFRQVQSIIHQNLTVNIGECLIKRRSRDSIKEDIEAIRSIMTLLSDRLTYLGDPKQGLAEDLLKVSII